MAEPTKVVDHPGYVFYEKNNLLRQTDEDYKPPQLPFPIVDEEDFKTIPSFGYEMKKHFMLRDDMTFVQHGSYGASLKCAIKAMRKWQDEMEAQPCDFMNRKVLFYHVLALRKLAKFVGANPEDLAFVNNATMGFNCVIRSLDFTDKDSILSLNLGYDAVTFTTKFVSEKSNAVMDIVTIPSPFSKQTIIDTIRSNLKENTKLVIVDHITSGTALVMPIDEIIAICKEKNVPIFIDGAHAVGQVALNLNKSNPDFYVSNCHKWLCAPKGVAFLRIDKKWQNKIHPVTISHGWGKGFSAEFLWAATMDYSPYLSMLTVLEFFSRVGENKIREYNHNLVVKAGKFLSEKWNTQVLVTDESMIGNMLNVGLPFPEEVVPYEKIKNLHETLWEKYKIEAVLIPIMGKGYVRLSAQIYNEMQDYEKLGEAVLELLK